MRYPRVVTSSLVLLLLLSPGCGGPDADAGEGESPGGSPSEAGSQAPGTPEIPETPETTPHQAAGGFLSFAASGNWEVDVVSEAPPVAYENIEEPVWEFTPQARLAELSVGGLDTTIWMERSFETASEESWRVEAVADLVSSIGLPPTDVLAGTWTTHTWAQPGEPWTRLSSRALDGHFISVLAQAEAPPDSALKTALDALVDSITVDPAALPPLQHALDARIVLQGTQGDELFGASVLAPRSWVLTEQVSEIVFEDPSTAEGAEGAVLAMIVRDSSPTADATERPPEGRPTLLDPVRVTGESQGVAYVALFDGQPGAAETVQLFARDAGYDFAAHLHVPGQPDVVADMVSTLAFLHTD